MYRKKAAYSVLAMLCVCIMASNVVFAAETSSWETTDQVRITAEGRYINWDGVTNVAQFKGPDGCLYYAIDSDDTVTVHKAGKNGPQTKTISLKKRHSIFGTAICDDDGNFYLVTGEINNTSNTDVETVFISKYDSSGKHIKTVGDNGSSSLAYYYGSSFYTKEPFSGGCCDAAINGNILSVHYARTMYSGHQSNSVFSVNINDMSKASMGVFYESHSFAQRVVSTADGFVYMSEGDCYDRSYTAYCAELSDGKYAKGNKYSIFDFWVADGTYDKYDMWVLNNNFSHMGGLAALPNGNVAFAAQSAKSLSEKAYGESEEIFIQIFNPKKNLADPSAYVTSGTRSGLAGPNGRIEVTDYGVKWITSYGNDYEVSDVQIAVDEGGDIIVLYALYENNKYQGVYYIVLNQKGKVIQDAALFSKDALLNPCEMPVCLDGRICWVGNRYGDTENKIYIYYLDPFCPLEIMETPAAIPGLIYNGEAQELVSSGAVSGGSIWYALGEEDGSKPDDGYSKSVPKAVNAGTYNVWYMVKDNSNNIAAVDRIVVTIGKAVPTFTAPIAKRLTYTGSEQELVYEGMSNGGTMYYAIGEDAAEEPAESAYTASIPMATDVGTYIVWYKIVGDANYIDAESDYVIAEIKSEIGPPPAEQGIAVNANNFPDRIFRNYVIQFDTNLDGYFSDKELNAVTWIDCSQKNISSLTGIEHFTSLRSLFCYENRLTSLDVSGCTALTVLYCESNQLTSLAVYHCTALTVLWCYDNQLTGLDISSAPLILDVVENGSKIELYDAYYYIKDDNNLLIDKTTELITSVDYVPKPTITAIANNSKSVKVTWNKVTGASKYYVYRAIGGSAFSKIATVSNGDNFYSDTEANTNNTKYSYYVVAYKTVDGETYKSKKSDVKETYFLKKMSAPTLSNTATGVKVTWAEVKGASGYYVYRSTKDGAFEYVKIKDGTATSYTDTVASKNNTKYTYYIKAYKTVNGTTYKSYKSTTTDIYFMAQMDKPSLSNTSTGVKVTWEKASGASGYYIYRKTGSGDKEKIKTITSGSTLTYTDTAAKTNGTKYTYYVYAYKTVDDTKYKSYTSSGAVKYYMSKLTISSLTSNTAGKLTVKWGKNSKATGYQIYYSTSSSFSNYKSVTISDPATVSKTISSLTSGKTYYVKVRAYKTVSSTKYYSPWSSVKSVKVK